mgnify:CR=1 FL=1
MISALDLKSYYMARAGITTWEQTRRIYIDERLGLAPDHTHHALEDAQGQPAQSHRREMLLPGCPLEP